MSYDISAESYDVQLIAILTKKRTHLRGSSIFLV